jgi:hypothetical protein
MQHETGLLKIIEKFGRRLSGGSPLNLRNSLLKLGQAVKKQAMTTANGCLTVH